MVKIGFGFDVKSFNYKMLCTESKIIVPSQNNRIFFAYEKYNV